MPGKIQSFESHTAWSPLYHFIGVPITLLNVFVALRHAWYVGGRYAWWNVIFAFGVAAGIAVSRLMVLAVQDRVIRLEMRLRLREVLPAAMHGDISRLTVSQLVGLRFAGDAELSELVQRVLKGEFSGQKGAFREQKAIKAAIKDWQADWQRA